MVDWGYFDKFEEVEAMYLPSRGEGDNRATQIVTAVCKLIYKWYNDGDVFDNTYALGGWCNDLSSYANWLRDNAGAASILDRIATLSSEGEYESLLKDLADSLLDKDLLHGFSKQEKVGSIYDCPGPYRFDENWGDDEDED